MSHQQQSDRQANWRAAAIVRLNGPQKKGTGARQRLRQRNARARMNANNDANNNNENNNSSGSSNSEMATAINATVLSPTPLPNVEPESTIGAALQLHVLALCRLRARLMQLTDNLPHTDSGRSVVIKSTVRNRRQLATSYSTIGAIIDDAASRLDLILAFVAELCSGTLSTALATQISTSMATAAAAVSTATPPCSPSTQSGTNVMLGGGGGGDKSDTAEAEWARELGRINALIVAVRATFDDILALLRTSFADTLK